MKKILVPGVREECEFVCDSCKKDAYGCLQFSFWYGSVMDMTQASIHLCDDCAKIAKVALNSALNITIRFVSVMEL